MALEMCNPMAIICVDSLQSFGSQASLLGDSAA
jgi:hypothetical protein